MAKLPAQYKPILDAIVGMILKAAKLGGFWSWIGGYVLKYGGQQVYDAFMTWMHDFTRTKEQQAAKAEVEKVVQDPNSTAEQRGQAYEKYFNSGRGNT